MNWISKQFNQLTLEELYEILFLRCNVFIVEQNCPYLDIDHHDQESTHLFLKNEENIIAYCRILPPGISYQEASIGRVVVDNNFRGSGHARILMEKAIEYVFNEMNLNEIKISGQAYLVKFYESLGFICVSEPYLEDNIKHVDLYLNKSKREKARDEI
ncbi:GNAT family N-acetyltransferase [Facklamia lactis]|uniref:GNAT family N-acetyltransferase n=1 Tax=Facklamia lactis TaxID=2749967 RepID=UPI0018CEABAB|nr:GNAT family N-acetyltransferase [Facklamia lactis]MBG9979899.1 GNAT family N-acetyltransferase [Facklamia lactis]